MSFNDCPFCSPDESRVFLREELVLGLWDGFPVSPGHALLIPLSHVSTWDEASLEERQALTAAIIDVQERIRQEREPDGFNIGMNIGTAAGQTVPHLHLHVIPRYRGDVADPRGGIRWVVPDRADYWGGSRK